MLARRALLPLSTPLVAAWAAWQSARGMRRGAPLSATQARLAAAVGVAQPERIRLVLVEHVPIPAGRWIDRIARRFGLPGADVDGLTLGHAIFIRDGALTPELLAHECRHVQQCEASGSLHAFLAIYLRQVARHGYRDAPFEADAREAALHASHASLNGRRTAMALRGAVHPANSIAAPVPLPPSAAARRSGAAPPARCAPGCKARAPLAPHRRSPR